MTTPVDLDSLEALCRAATPGPWRKGNVDRDRIFVQHEGGIGPERVLLIMNKHFPSEDDADFIAAANPAAILELVERVREAEAILLANDLDPCQHCAFTGGRCRRLWPAQRKCCPDCTHKEKRGGVVAVYEGP